MVHSRINTAYEWKSDAMELETTNTATEHKKVLFEISEAVMKHRLGVEAASGSDNQKV